MRNEFYHGATVQCCPQCNNGMRWDNETGRHIPADEYDFKHWTGPSNGWLQMFHDAVKGKWEPDVCAGNAYRLIGMAVFEIRMLKVFLAELEHGNTLKFPHLFDNDIAWVSGLLRQWEALVKEAKVKFADIPEVANA